MNKYFWLAVLVAAPSFSQEFRGTLSGSNFVGEVLLKPLDEHSLCNGLTVGWVPIKMSFDGPDKLAGMWLQSWTASGQECLVVDQSWQPYRLERLPSHFPFSQ